MVPRALIKYPDIHASVVKDTADITARLEVISIMDQQKIIARGLSRQTSAKRNGVSLGIFISNTFKQYSDRKNKTRRPDEMETEIQIPQTKGKCKENGLHMILK